MENHHVQRENSLSMVMFNSYVTDYQRVITLVCRSASSSLVPWTSWWWQPYVRSWSTWEPHFFCRAFTSSGVWWRIPWPYLSTYNCFRAPKTNLVLPQPRSLAVLLESFCSMHRRSDKQRHLTWSGQAVGSACCSSRPAPLEYWIALQDDQLLNVGWTEIQPFRWDTKMQTYWTPSQSPDQPFIGIKCTTTIFNELWFSLRLVQMNSSTKLRI